MTRYSNQSHQATRNYFVKFWVLIWLQAFFAGFAEGWLFSRSEPSISENEPCDPLDQAWRPYPGDRTKFLYCEVSQRRFLVGTCQALNGIPKYFDATKQLCVENFDQQRPEFSSPPPIRERRVGETCSANKECSDGMYCNNGACVCFLNYIEVNLKCIRVSSVCTSTHFYAEQSSGKPRTCVLDAHCAPGFSCDIHPEAPDISFCCYKSADKTINANVCGTSKAYTQNGKEVSCSVDLSHCPFGYSCQYNSYMNRHFCCEVSRTEWLTSSGLPSTFFTTSSVFTTATSTPRSTLPTMSPLEEVRVQTIALAESVCGIGSAPWLYEGYPMSCNPNPVGNCPPSYSCKSRIGTKLYFCCVDPTQSTPNPVIIPTSTIRPVTNEPVQQAQICSQSAPYLLNGQPLMCIGSDPNSCPEGYICETRVDQSQQPKLQLADHHHFMFSNISFCCSVFVSTMPPSKSTLIPAATTFSLAPRAPSRGDSQLSEKPLVCPTWKSEAFKIKDKPVMCIKTDPQSCPNPYTCEYHEPSRVYYCCKDTSGISIGLNSSSSTTSFLSTSITSISSVSTMLTPSTPKFEIDGCPPQTAAAVDQKGRIIVCSLINAPPGCPPGFNCLYSEFHSRYQCCGVRSTSTIGVLPVGLFSTQSPPATLSSTFQPSVIEDGCPSGQRAYKDPSTQQPISCVANQLDSCPGGYFCQFSAKSNKFQCCGVHAGCPNDNIAYISLVTGAVQYCNQDDKSCPPGYRCDKGQNNQKVCCSNRNLPNALPNLDIKVCPVGDPLMDVQQKLKLCSDLNLCPFGYTCLPSAKGPVCCPDPQMICTLPVTFGQQCANSGESKKTTRYYFNTEKGVCQPFQYEGCSGNANNFETLQECSAFCFQGLCARGLPARFDSNTPLRCSNAKQDCPPDYTCSAAAFGPQGAYVCCPKPDLICTLYMHEGQKCEENGKSQPIIRFFYDSHRGNCQPFSYHGCGGNANNFLSISQCQSFCGGFTTTYASNPSTPTVTLPSTIATPASAPTVTSSSPVSTTFGATVGILASQVCPIVGEYLPTDPLYHSCNPAVPYSCPHGYSCQNATKQTGGFVCCGSPTLHIKGPTCPIGSDVYIHPVTHQPHACTLDRNGCPDKFICMFSEPLREYFCCSSHLPPTTLLPKAEICADGDPFLYPGTFQPLSCRPGTVCPRGFECKLASNNEEHVCCASNQKPIDLNGDSRDNSPRYYARPSQRTFLPVQPSWYPLAGGFQTWNNGMVDANVMTQRTTQFRPSLQPAIWTPGKIGKIPSGPKLVIDQTYCNKSDSRQLGTECCAHEQCAYNFCSDYKDTKYCACPRHLLLDFTYEKPRCVNSCSKWREGAFCVPTPPDVPLGLIRLRFGTRLMDKTRRS